MPRSDQQTIGRRRLLRGLGATVAGTAGTLALTRAEALAGVDTSPGLEPLAETVEGPAVLAAPDPRFSRMFQLPAFANPGSAAVREAMLELGRAGGLMDAKDPLHEGPIRLITNPELSPDNRDQDLRDMTAGTTFVGQFLDHDVTFDTVSRLGVATEPTQTRNTRDARIDLDSVYGGGPTASPQLYSSSDAAKFRVESGGLFEDLPRMSDRTAIIGDPRNDENLIISGLHAAFLLAHNRTVDFRRANNLPGDVWFYARRTMIHHWQWIVVHEFLPQIVGQPLVDDIFRNGLRWYRFGNPTIPVEFQTGVYRFGHSLVRPSYRANLAGDRDATGAPAPFFGFIFDRAGAGQPDPVDLRGRARARRRFVGWQTFFDFGGDQTQHVRPNKRIDTNISTPLFDLPLQAIASGDPPTALPQRNLLRHLTWSLPSGQRIAAATGSPVLASSNFPELRAFGLGLESSTPLWYYVLREAAVVHNGVRLGPVGGRIVAETILGLLARDEFSYLNTGFRPSLPSSTAGRFTMTDLLRWARVDPASRRQ
ncbi:peroxidase family protein [Phytohabitans sp. LJ34]|uniref:peroxidase family protein n=1 Tax=Phytohabitans sp. LJ34 TaxID=3452217 RepID=UPI003F890A02